MTIPRNQADPNPSGGYRDRILHYDETSPPEGDLYVLSGFYDDGSPRYVQGMQAPSAQAVTAGHGECECAECSSGWSYRWDEFMAGR